MRLKEHFEEQKILSSNKRRKKEIFSSLLVIKRHGRVPKRLKTGDEPNAEAIKVKVKVESDNNKEEEEEESSDDDNNEEEEDEGEEEQVAQPVARVEQPGYIPLRQYVPPRPNFILVDCNVSMGDEVIPDNKVIRPIIRQCDTKLDPVYWGENSIDRCPTYGVCQVCCSSGPTGRHCHICLNKDVIYVCMSRILKTDRGEEITRMVDAQWISRIFEATHTDTRVDRVQATHCINPWGCATMEWLKNRMIKKYQDLNTNGEMIATDDEIKSRAVQTVRLI
jgi:hypothetical protein